MVVGYDAVMDPRAWLPLLWPLAVVGSLPGVSAVGRRVYNAIAASRPRDVPCTDEVCGIHPQSGQGRAEQASSTGHSEGTPPSATHP